MTILTFTTLAYVGPGAGLGAVGALFAVLAAVLLGLVGLVLYPVQILRRRFAKPTDTKLTQDSSKASPE